MIKRTLQEIGNSFGIRMDKWRARLRIPKRVGHVTFFTSHGDGSFCDSTAVFIRLMDTWHEFHLREDSSWRLMGFTPDDC